VASVFIRNRSNRFTIGGEVFIATMPDTDNERTDDIDGGEDE